VVDSRVVGLMRRVVPTKHAIILIIILRTMREERGTERETESENKVETGRDREIETEIDRDRGQEEEAR
jgi:hypothetical protein